jgi:hypothetical protein
MVGAVGAIDCPQVQLLKDRKLFTRKGGYAGTTSIGIRGYLDYSRPGDMFEHDWEKSQDGGVKEIGKLLMLATKIEHE